MFNSLIVTIVSICHALSLRVVMAGADHGTQCYQAGVSVMLPESATPVGTHLIFTKEHTADEEVERYKARLVHRDSFKWFLLHLTACCVL